MKLKILNICIWIFVISFVGYISYVFYIQKPESTEVSPTHVTTGQNRTSVNEWIEQNKRDKEKWEKENPLLTQKLKEKDINSTLTIRKTLPEIQNLCGSPSDSRYDKFFDGTIDVYTYHSGACRGRTLFDTGNGLALTE